MMPGEIRPVKKYNYTNFYRKIHFLVKTFVLQALFLRHWLLPFPSQTLYRQKSSKIIKKYFSRFDKLFLENSKNNYGYKISKLYIKKPKTSRLILINSYNNAIQF